jgi:RimJ/RimL family protein N-acetyltransferase
VRPLDAGLVPDVPVIRTPRLVLRGPRPTDLDAVLTWLADPAAMRFVGDGRPRSRTEAAHFLASSAERFESSGFGFWLVTLDDAEAAARSAASDVPSGDVPSGDVPSGDVPSGDVVSGDAPIGDVGIWPIPTSGRRGFRGPELELGYRFALPHHRRGYATEAARALLAHAGEHGLDALVAVTHPENLASQAVLRKCGFADEGVTERDLRVVTPRCPPVDPTPRELALSGRKRPRFDV